MGREERVLFRLDETLAALSNALHLRDFAKSDQEIYDLVDSLNSFSESALIDDDDEEEEEAEDDEAFRVIQELYNYLTSPALDQEVVDALSCQLSGAVARFACVSTRCADVASDVIRRFTDVGSPRDMITILCEALGSATEMFRVPNYFVPLLSGIAEALGSIKRRHFEQCKVAVPIILNVLKAIALDLDAQDMDCENLFHKTIDIAHSIQEIIMKLEGEDGNQYSALFCLFILQTMALVTIGMRNEVSRCASLVLQLAQFLRQCNLSYVGLIMEHDIDSMIKVILSDGDGQSGCFSHVKHGLSLAVVWGYKSDEIAMAAGLDFTSLRGELQRDQTKRWHTVGMMKYIFSSTTIPWELKKYAISFLLSILEGNAHHISQGNYEDYSIYIPTLYSSLQGILMVIMYSPDAALRKHAFEAFKKVLGDVPATMRFDILVALVKNNDSSSMIAILLHCIKEEMHAEIRNICNKVSQEDNSTAKCTGFWNTAILDLIQFVLRPPKGGPPDLPEYSDAVLSSLNLYRFILITESSGKTNYTGALLKDCLQRAYEDWLLPLRTLVTGILVENQDCDQQASDTICALNPIELVLYRCIELVEEYLKNQI